MKKLKIIMIDAFKPDYLSYAPYLSSLTRKFQWGELEMPLGHGGGLEILFKGTSDILATFYKKENSSLKWIRYFLWIERFDNYGRLILDCMINFQRIILRKELHRTGKIPTRKLMCLEMHDSKKNYRNLNISYKYFPELDKIGHKYGPNSKEIISEIKKVDRKISKMKFDLILSDHGMIEVNKKISVPETKNCIIDSDMARYWGNEEELILLKRKLPLKEGKIINWPNKSFGDLIFLANPGILILPNYWGKEIKGMHGYDGKHKDMKAIYILNQKGTKENLRIEKLHEIFLQKLKLFDKKD